jgi:thiol-disulfide isomerase/thioredoxin
MMKRILFSIALGALTLLTAGAGLYSWNQAPVVPAIPSAEAAGNGRPYVIKLHAQWCPKCMMTKGAWSDLQARYAGRVNFLVFDYTSQRTTDASGIDARRVGLGAFFENAGGTGSVVVLDGATKEVVSWISGVHDVSAYAAAVDAALGRAGV